MLTSTAQMDSFKFLLKRGVNVCTTVNGSAVLLEAVQRNRVDFVEYLIANVDKLGLDLHVTDRQGSNLLMYAATVGNIDIFRRLVEAGCVVDADVNGRTVFMQAALHGHVDLLRYLTLNASSLGIKIEQADNDGRNAIFYGIESGCLEVLIYLVSIGIRCRTDKTGKTNLMQSTRAGNDVIAEYLLAHAQMLGLDVCATDNKGENALFYAVRSRKTSAVSALLDQGCLRLVNNVYGMSVISLCIAHNLDDILTAVLDRECARGDQEAEEVFSARDAKGRTALNYFIERGDIERLRRYGQYYRHHLTPGFVSAGREETRSVTLLMEACRGEGIDGGNAIRRLDVVRCLVEELHVDLYQTDARRRCALFYAVESENVMVTSYLLEKMTSPAQSDVNGLTVLMVAVVTGNLAIVTAILNSKFSRDLLNRVDKNGRNAVHHCAMHDCIALLTDLLAGPHRVNVNLSDTLHSRTALMYAAENGHHATVACLINRGAADVDLVDCDGRNALHYCVSGSIGRPSLYCARELVRRGIDVNLADVRGVTPLMLACQSCAKTNITVVRLLLDQGADPIAQDLEGKDAFDYCPFDSEYAKGVLREKTEIRPAQRDALIAFQDSLFQVGGAIQIKNILRELLKEGVFTKTLSFEVMKRPQNERFQKLVDLLATRGENAFNTFCLILKKEGVNEISYRLQKEAYRREPEIYW